MDPTISRSEIARKASHELLEYAAISVYLYVCLGSLLLYKAAILRSEGIAYAPYGLGLVKALILGKFIVAGRALKVGERFESRPLIYPILHKSLAFLVLLIGLDLAEEVIAGWLHGRSLAETFVVVTGDSWLQILATCLIFLLILVPYFAYHELSRRLGGGALSRMLWREGAHP